MAKKYKEIGVLRSRFEEGVTAPESAEKWSSRAAEGAGDYETNFAPVYRDMTACANDVKGKGLGSWEALKAYGDCMYRKRARGGGRGGA
jgi:hypothetical protein